MTMISLIEAVLLRQEGRTGIREAGAVRGREVLLLMGVMGHLNLGGSGLWMFEERGVPMLDGG